MRNAKPVGMLLWLLAVVIGLDQNMAAGQSPSAGLSPSQVMLIRNTLTAVNHGNISGNYTVLRDLGSERFRKEHNCVDLAATFGELRQQKLDLSPVLITEPQLTEQLVQTPTGGLKFVGVFPTRPRAVHFALVFQRVEAGWMIDSIAISVPPAQAAQQAPPQRPTAVPAREPQFQQTGYAEPVNAPSARRVR